MTGALWMRIAVTATAAIALFFAGWFARGDKDDSDLVKELNEKNEQLVFDIAALLRSAQEIEQEGRDHEAQIRNVKARAVIEIDPDGCRPDEFARLRINSRKAARFRSLDRSSSVPGEVRDTSRHAGDGDLRAVSGLPR